MVGCSTDSDCPFMFYCTQEFSCEHKPFFPIQFYPALVYILIPIGSGFVNVVGKSMGILKVVILMNFLRYDSSQSTALIQPMVAGSALPNILNVLFKKHPYINTSLIDYDIILVIIPCSLLGSTLGSFIQKLLPSIVKDIVIILFFMSFAYNFYKKSKTFKDPQNSQQKQKQNMLISNMEINENQQQLSAWLQSKKQAVLRYEQSVHLRDIIISLAVFLVFQLLVFLVQGKFWFYTVKLCSGQYIAGLAGLVLIVIVYQEIIRQHMAKKHYFFKKINVKRNFDLSITRNFGLICFGGYFAGLAQGILGVGSGTFIMGVFMALNLNPRVAAATSSYQILFVGMAAFLEQFITNNITLAQALFLFLLTFVGGGLFTMFLYWILKKFEDKKVNRFLISVMFTLCLLSAISMIPFLIQSCLQFGISYLTEIKFHC